MYWAYDSPEGLLFSDPHDCLAWPSTLTCTCCSRVWTFLSLHRLTRGRSQASGSHQTFDTERASLWRRHQPATAYYPSSTENDTAIRCRVVSSQYAGSAPPGVTHQRPSCRVTTPRAAYRVRTVWPSSLLLLMVLGVHHCWHWRLLGSLYGCGCLACFCERVQMSL